MGLHSKDTRLTGTASHTAPSRLEHSYPKHVNQATPATSPTSRVGFTSASLQRYPKPMRQNSWDELYLSRQGVPCHQPALPLECWRWAPGKLASTPSLAARRAALLLWLRGASLQICAHQLTSSINFTVAAAAAVCARALASTPPSFAPPTSSRAQNHTMHSCDQ